MASQFKGAEIWGHEFFGSGLQAFLQTQSPKKALSLYSLCAVYIVLLHYTLGIFGQK